MVREEAKALSPKQCAVIELALDTIKVNVLRPTTVEFILRISDIFILSFILISYWSVNPAKYICLRYNGWFTFFLYSYKSATSYLKKMFIKEQNPNGKCLQVLFALFLNLFDSMLN